MGVHGGRARQACTAGVHVPAACYLIPEVSPELLCHEGHRSEMYRSERKRVRLLYMRDGERRAREAHYMQERES